MFSTTDKGAGPRPRFSLPFLLITALFTASLTVSNFFASKVFLLGPFTLSGAVILFPVTYILNDCLAEVYGYRKARLVIWTGFALNLFFVIVAQLEILLPGAPFWDGQEGFRLVFGATPRALAASLLAFLVGSNLNAIVMSRMKLRSRGKNFVLRAIISSLLGELSDSLIFVPVMFWALGLKQIALLIAGQVTMKVLYEIIIMPVTRRFVRDLKHYEGEDVFDEGVSYNPLKIFDL